MDPDQTVIGAVFSGSTLFASILKLSVMLGNYLQQMTSADVIFQMHFFLGALKVNFFLTQNKKIFIDENSHLFLSNVSCILMNNHR